MCGILGVWMADAVAGLEERVRHATTRMEHRGPDHQGFTTFRWDGGALAFGQTRLSIIDLTDAGHQPMRSRDGRYTVVYNGEVCNYRELRAELAELGHTFASDSDTEVLLAAWAQWGEAALPRLVGMFAFAMYDAATHSLTLARDAFGIKPLFYAVGTGWLAFASEPGPLRELLPQRPRLNLQRAYDYLVFGRYDDGADTFVEGVLHLLPGHVTRFTLDGGAAGEPRRWWWPSPAERADHSFADAADRIRSMFLDSVRLHLRSDVRLGAALSGGIDSSAIVCAMRAVEPDLPIHTFSFVAPGAPTDEGRWADVVAAQVGATAHKVRVAPEELAADLDDLIAAQSEPFGSTSIYAQYRVFRLAREEGVTVMLEGQGADELFAGYHGYPGPRMRGMVERGQFGSVLRFARAWSAWPGRSPALAAMALGMELAPRPVHALAYRVAGRSRPPWLNAGPLLEAGVRLERGGTVPPRELRGRRLAETLRFQLSADGLPALLRHGDRNSMRWSVESRVPFLTTALAEYVLALPEEYLVSRAGETKHVLRAAFRGLVPDPILDRRDKVGFDTPEQAWLGAIAGQVRDWLRTDLGLPFFNHQRVVTEFEAMLAGHRPFGWQAWRWINFSRWYVRHLG
jgi:asparagine synthase (glutamine-hydrolysing)